MLGETGWGWGKGRGEFLGGGVRKFCGARVLVKVGGKKNLSRAETVELHYWAGAARLQSFRERISVRFFSRARYDRPELCRAGARAV